MEQETICVGCEHLAICAFKEQVARLHIEAQKIIPPQPNSGVVLGLEVTCAYRKLTLKNDLKIFDSYDTTRAIYETYYDNLHQRMKKFGIV